MTQYDVVMNRVDRTEATIRVTAPDACTAVTIAKSSVRDGNDPFEDGECIDSSLELVSVNKVEANPDNDEFECEICVRICDIDDSHKLPSGKLICYECYEG